VAEFDSVIPAGGSGTLKAKVHTSPGQNRKLTKTVSVSTDSPIARQLTLRLSLDVVSPIVVLPRPNMMLTATVGAETSDRILLRRSDGKPLKIEKMTVNIPDLLTLKTIEVKDTDEDYRRLQGQPGDLWLEATALPQKVTSSKSVQAVLHTNHPDQPELQLALVLRVREAVEALPTTVQIRVRDGRALGRQANATIRSNTNDMFEVTGVEVSHPEIFTADVLTKGERTAHTLRIQLAEGLDESTLSLPFKGHIRAKTSAAVKPLVELDLLVSEHSYRSARPPSTRVRRPVDPVQPGRLAPTPTAPTTESPGEEG
jgi:predicted nucleic acid-binding protein